MFDDFFFYLQQYLDLHRFLIPLGFIGIWRWSVWIFKELVALRYRPKTKPFKSGVSLVTPVYNENPKVFKQALESWQQNKPTEIIAVIDYTDTSCIKVFQSFAKKHKNAHLVITKIPGKRPALANGIKKAKEEIVVLVDSDTIWAKDVIKNALPPFNDKKVAGVGTYQSVYEPKTLAQKIFDIQLDLRYRDEMPFLAAAGDALVCLSGRTAFYRRKVILPMLPDLVHETFMGKPVISGDDKRLTYLVLAAGWKVGFQNNSRVYTPGMADLKSYLLQRLRWSRNSLRADLRALSERWPFHHPALVFFQFDKIAQAFVVVLSPIYFLVSLALGLWLAAAVIFVWWFVSRTIKMYPHLSQHPKDIVLLPAFILYSFLTGIIKVYAFFSLNTQGWITRWDKSRLPRIQFLKLLPAYGATVLFFLLLVLGVVLYKRTTYIIPHEKEEILIAHTLLTTSKATSSVNNKAGLAISNNGLLVTKYVVQQGDSLSSVAQKFGISTETLLIANVARLTNWNRIEPGFTLSIPGKDTKLTLQNNFNYQRIYPDKLQIFYDEPSDTIIVSGRGSKITLSDIRNSVGNKYLEEVTPKVWYLKANLYLRSGVTLRINKDEVQWLKLESNKNKFVTILGYNGTIFINGVKISSWDEYNNNYDIDMKDGRSYILVKDGSRMDIENSDVGYLGYPRTPDLNASPYGVSWRMSTGKLHTTLLTGEVVNSKFHNNYFGVFTFGATGMLFKGNEFYNNVRYGFDPHDDSAGFLIENNVSHDNGSHGFIVSKRCINNVFRNNVSYHNKLHGIMLHEESNHNVIENNVIYDNTDGIALWHSSDNLIRNNKVYDNKSGFRANSGSISNAITNNTITNNSSYGIYLYEGANDNTIATNTIAYNKTGLYIKTNKNVIKENVIDHNTAGVFLTDFAKANYVTMNKITYNKKYGIYSKIQKGSYNYMSQNTLRRNRFDVAALTPTPSEVSYMYEIH